MSTPTVMRHAALLLIVLGILVWLAGLAALIMLRGPYWRVGIGCGGLLVFVGCWLWHASRMRGGPR